MKSQKSDDYKGMPEMPLKTAISLQRQMKAIIYSNFIMESERGEGMEAVHMDDTIVYELNKDFTVLVMNTMSRKAMNWILSTDDCISECTA